MNWFRLFSITYSFSEIRVIGIKIDACQGGELVRKGNMFYPNCDSGGIS
jgi:hypothetical protein